jgi:oligopeptide/dipeptide ABC transporter ATP-binding protein
MSQPLLVVDGLKTDFDTRAGIVRAVDGVSFTVRAGEFVGLVGESGCGKSVTAMSILRLVSAQGVHLSGRVVFDGEDVHSMDEAKLRSLRGNRIGVVFQDPMTSLNPVFTIGEQIAEGIRLHRGLSKADALSAAIEAMEEVAIPDAERRAKDYPHQLSGGMRQRVMIAMALACDPELLIADEPTTALDVTIQAQILELIDRLRRDRNLAVLLITHDLGVVAEFADKVCVMYTGRIVEQAPTAVLFSNPKHPYTRGLLSSVPKLGGRFGKDKVTRLQTIEGTVPNPTELPAGCHFAPRCSHVTSECSTSEIEMIDAVDESSVRCLLHLPNYQETGVSNG